MAYTTVTNSPIDPTLQPRSHTLPHVTPTVTSTTMVTYTTVLHHIATPSLHHRYITAATTWCQADELQERVVAAESRMVEGQGAVAQVQILERQVSQLRAQHEESARARAEDARQAEDARAEAAALLQAQGTASTVGEEARLASLRRREAEQAQLSAVADAKVAELEDKLRVMERERDSAVARRQEAEVAAVEVRKEASERTIELVQAQEEIRRLRERLEEVQGRATDAVASVSSFQKLRSLQQATAAERDAALERCKKLEQDRGAGRLESLGTGMGEEGYIAELRAAHTRLAEEMNENNRLRAALRQQSSERNDSVDGFAL
mmetsp:Transcript_63208/g.149792  ORF Transcript_63208/g.149792 Transcript_63208/m.149792 type:complete len:322 (-) Transcript_63208:21-986(-)